MHESACSGWLVRRCITTLKVLRERDYSVRNTRKFIAVAAVAVLSGAACSPAARRRVRKPPRPSRPQPTACLRRTRKPCSCAADLTEGVAREDYALQWRCNAYLINVDLSGEQTFRIQDARLGGGVLFGGPPGATTALQLNTAFVLTGGLRADAGELKYVFAGPATVRLDFGGTAASRPSRSARRVLWTSTRNRSTMRPR